MLASLVDKDRDTDIENVIGATMVFVPPGEFRMGTAESFEDLARGFRAYECRRILTLDDETPAHRVRITSGFFLGKHPVTVGQFAEFVERTGYRTEPERDGTGGYGFNPANRTFEGRSTAYSWRNTGFPQDDDHPVVNITWNDAAALCEWLTAVESRRYRLPTEAEWEYACRAGTTTRYCCGDDVASLADYANLCDAATATALPDWARFALESDNGFPFTAPVGSFRPNAFGLYDMHGNVWEWCNDWHEDDYYARSPVDDPPGPAEGEVKVRRGGAWHSWPLYVRSAFRNYNSPESRYVGVGMRLAMSE